MKRSRVPFALALVLLVSRPVAAQIVSPGPLSASHAELQGLRQCTSCHRLGQRGAAEDRCFDCHAALGARVRAGAGLHAHVRERTCGSCHAEHYGRDFQLVRFDTTALDHAALGYPLRSAHAQVSCRGCHRSGHVTDAAVRAEKRTAEALRRTFLGLGEECRSCHAAEDSHGGQFDARDCVACHRETRWDEASAFDHGATPFRLTGRHAVVECSGCHAERNGAIKYRGVTHETCAACHADPHRGAERGACSSCHTTDGWLVLGAGFDARRFDHARTGFPLRAAHARVECAGCHRVPARVDDRIRITLARVSAAARYPQLVVEDCRSCHVPAHPGARPGRGAGANCAACHGEDAWVPAGFGSREHAAARFALDGAHLLVACDRCHGTARAGILDFRRPDASCAGCHDAISPHGRAYADTRGRTDCARCHGTASWDPRQTPHDAFPLTGAHAVVPCSSCHSASGAGAPRQCDACHGARDPHGGRSAGRGCGDCHDSDGFRGASRFDHGTTRFVLDGAHARAACRACHERTEPTPGAIVLRYAPVSTRCADCHGD